MGKQSLIQLTYWGGWASAAVAVVYKILFTLGMGAGVWQATQVAPRHFWQLSFLLFIICIASYVRGRSQTA